MKTRFLISTYNKVVILEPAVGFMHKPKPQPTARASKAILSSSEQFSLGYTAAFSHVLSRLSLKQLVPPP